MNRRFLLLLVVFAAGVIAQSWAMPVMEGSDEPIHYTYVELLRQDGRLPDRTTFRTNSTRQESGQPPLTYWLAALTADALRLPSPGDDEALAHMYTVRNHWITAPNAWNRTDNINHYLHGRDEHAFNSPEIVAAIRALRLTSLVYGLLAVIGAYGAAREVFKRDSWALTAAGIFAFMPTLIHLASYFNNDISAIAFSTLALWQSLRLLRVGASPLRLLLIGGLLALGALSKVSVLLVAPGVGVALLIDVYARRQSVLRLIGHGLLVGLPLVVVFAPWLVWGAVTYGDPFGFSTHFNRTLSYSDLLTPSQILALMPEIYLSYWGKFGLAKIYLHPVTYTAFGVLAALSLARYGVGLGRWWKNRVDSPQSSPPRLAALDSPSPLRWGGGRGWGWSGHLPTLPSQRLTLYQAIVLGVAALTVFAGLVRWMQQIAIITGRLMYPAHIAIAIGLTGGLYLLARPRERAGLRLAPTNRIASVGAGLKPARLTQLLQSTTLALLAVSGVVISPLVIYEAYAPPPLLTRETLPALTGGAFDYEGTIRLLGMTQPDPRIRDALHPLTLCWEVLKAAERPAAFSVKLVRDGLIVADRTSFHGMGRYPASEWHPGDLFCDTIELPMDDPDVVDDPLPQPGTVYDVMVVLLDPETKDVNWQPAALDGTPVQFPIVGQVISPAGNMTGASVEGQNVVIRFPGFANLGDFVVVDATGDPFSAGDSISLSLRWDVTGTTPDTWTQFVHLVNAESGKSWSMADGQPMGGRYPAWAWAAGEVLIDQWNFNLPDDLPTGEYTLQLGFYRQDTGARLPVEQRGQPVPDSAAVLQTMYVEP